MPGGDEASNRFARSFASSINITGSSLVISHNRRFQIDQKKANIAQILLLREIRAICAVFFLFIIIKIKKISPETRIIRPTSISSISSSAGRNEDSVKTLGFWHFFVSRNPRNLRPESSPLVSTSLTHSGDDEDPEDSGIISLFVLLESPESSRRIQLQNVCVLH